MFWKTLFVAFFALIILSVRMAPLARAEPDAPATAPTMYVEVFLASEGESVKPEKIVGNLLAHDEVGIEIQTGDARRSFAWDQLTPTSAYTLKSRLINRTSAIAWLELGRWGWNHRLKKQATIALNKARQLDRGLASEVDAILRSEPGAMVEPTEEAEDKVATEVNKPEKITRYQAATPEELEEAKERAEALKESAEKLASVELTTLETDHFIIYTDWEKAEFEWMKQQCEMAYRVVARQFRMSASDNVFIGKLPIIMFDHRADFESFASQHDDLPIGLAAGYYSGREDGSGHMVMWRPNRRLTGEVGRKDAENTWARILVHEFTHAYVARYKSNAFIPRWLNEGIADYIAQGVLPEGAYFAPAREAALYDHDVSDIFNDNFMPGWGYYPVMMSMVKMLAEGKPKAFMSMFDDIKNGMDGEEALKKHFKINYDELQKHWTDYARSLK